MVELFVEIAAFEDLRRVFAFVDDRIHRALERELHVLRQVVFDIHVAVPGKVLAERQIHRLCRHTCQIAHLHVAESTVHVRAECP